MVMPTRVPEFRKFRKMQRKTAKRRFELGPATPEDMGKIGNIPPADPRDNPPDRGLFRSPREISWRARTSQERKQRLKSHKPNGA